LKQKKGHTTLEVFDNPFEETVIKDTGGTAEFLARTQLVIPANEKYAVDPKRIEGTMAAISNHPLKKVNPAVVLSISPVRSNGSARL
jgi:hypothetical protein